jgi:S-adenosylmethionine:tRNA ribosyltransferase-isomerase
MSTTVVEAHRIRFSLPADLLAGEPPEDRGLTRDGVRLLVARPDGLTDSRFHQMGRYLRPGDLALVNTSATIAAALDGRRANGEPVVVHVSVGLDDGTWVIELRSSPNAATRVGDAQAGESVSLANGGTATLRGAHPDPELTIGSRLWRADVSVGTPFACYLLKYGRPISYGYLRGRFPLSAYQPIFAREPGSAEMASAGRPFSDALVTDLVTRGVQFAPLLLHSGVSSLESGEPPEPERFRVPETTARLVNATRAAGGRVIAVGTTVTRAIETVADPDGTVRAGHGWTDLLLGPDRLAHVVDGLVTGWHEPEASHLLLLEAVAGPELVQAAYDEAVAERYLWHEFGDSALLLP